MSQNQRPINKKVSRGTGGKRRGKQRDKKLAQYGRNPTLTRVSEKEVRTKVRVRGGSKKIRLKRSSFVNVKTADGIKKVKILSVLEFNNPDYVRRNIIVKSTILNTSIGKVKVTNRVGQDGIVNGVLLSPNNPTNTKA